MVGNNSVKVSNQARIPFKWGKQGKGESKRFVPKLGIFQDELDFK